MRTAIKGLLLILVLSAAVLLHAGSSLTPEDMNLSNLIISGGLGFEALPAFYGVDLTPSSVNGFANANGWMVDIGGTYQKTPFNMMFTGTLNQMTNIVTFSESGNYDQPYLWFWAAKFQWQYG